MSQRDRNSRRMQVRFLSKCSVCNAKIDAGEWAIWDSSTSLITHEACFNGDADRSKDPQVPGERGPVEGGYYDDPDAYDSDGDGEGSESDSDGQDGDSDGTDSDSDSDSQNESENDTPNPYEEGTRRHKIIEEHKAGNEPFETLKPKVEAQEEPFVLTKRVEGLGKVPRPMHDKVNPDGSKESGQLTEFRYEVNRTVAAYEKTKENQPKKDSKSKSESQQQDKANKKPNPVKQAEHFVKEMQRIRLSLDSEAGDSNAGRVDHVSYRPVQYGVRMLLNGISPASALFAFSLHWPSETRRKHGIKEYDPTLDAGTNIPEGEPTLLGYVRKLARARVPIMLIGPAGAGKSRMAERLADIDFNGRFASCPLTAGIMPSWLIGAHTVDGWKGRPFLDIYSNGGVFAFEEMDSADPNVLLIINNAIANGYLDNPNDGERYEMHPDFQPIACCNTMGLGADRFYVGRERLDFATIDRFRMGRVMVGMDNDVDFAILKNEIANYVQQ